MPRFPPLARNQELSHQLSPDKHRDRPPEINAVSARDGSPLSLGHPMRLRRAAKIITMIAVSDDNDTRTPLIDFINEAHCKRNSR